MEAFLCMRIRMNTHELEIEYIYSCTYSQIL